MKVIAIVLVFTLFGCATFQNKFTVDQNVILTNKTLNSLNGDFEISSAKTLRKFNNRKLKIFEKDSLHNHNLFGFMSFRDSLSPKINRDNFSVRIRIINKNNLSVRLLENNTAIDSLNLDYKLKKDGYIYLYFDEPNFKINQIPFLFGGFEISRGRLGLNQENELLWETTYFLYGAALVFIGDTRKYKSSSIYQRKQ